MLGLTDRGVATVEYLKVGRVVMAGMYRLWCRKNWQDCIRPCTSCLCSIEYLLFFPGQFKERYSGSRVP